MVHPESQPSHIAATAIGPGWQHHPHSPKVEEGKEQLPLLQETAPTDLGALDRQFRRIFQTHAGLIRRLQAADLRPGERKRLDLLLRVERVGLDATTGRRSQEGRRDVVQFIEDFVELGAGALLLTGTQRGGDFLNNQLRGRWAEDVVLSLALEGLFFRRLGPSGAAMPGTEDHRRIVSTFAAIQLLEGKRPDLVAFSPTTWSELSAADRERVDAWPERLLEPADVRLLRQAVCGIEVKNSTWHYRKRREAGGGPLSVTVKEEELKHLRKWSADYSLPILFLQVLFDCIYCMSFARMEAAIKRDYLYEKGDIRRDERGAGGKTFYHVYVTDERHYCADVVFPDESEAVVALLESGNVVPHVLLKPAKAKNGRREVVFREIDFRPGR